MIGEQAVEKWEVPEDAVFESSPILGHDQLIRPTSRDAMRLEGTGARGEVVEYVHLDENEGKIYHEMKQDIEPALKKIRELELEHGHNVGKNKAGDFYLAAHVPDVIIRNWLVQRGLKMRDFKYDVVDQFLNDPANSAFRVWKGKI